MFISYFDYCHCYYRYGALEGHSKVGLANLYGEEVVQRWRAGLADKPPAMSPGTGHDIAYTVRVRVCIVFTLFPLTLIL